MPSGRNADHSVFLLNKQQKQQKKGEVVISFSLVALRNQQNETEYKKLFDAYSAALARKTEKTAFLILTVRALRRWGCGCRDGVVTLLGGFFLGGNVGLRGCA